MIKKFNKYGILCLVFLSLFIIYSTAQAEFREHYVGVQYTRMGSSGETVDDTSNITLEYQTQVDYLKMFPTKAAYQWYFDVALVGSFFELERPVKNLGITPADPLVESEMKTSNYILEFGYSRKQTVNHFIQWTLGARFGGFFMHAVSLSGQTASGQSFNIRSENSLGLTISAFSGLTWGISKNYTLNTLFQLRKYYISEFTIHESASGKKFNYPDFTALGFSIGISRSF